MKEYINPILRISTVVVIMAVAIMQNNKINKLQSQAAVNVDSLQNEIFILQTEVGRYEMAAELLKEEDSVAGNKLQVILNKETE